MTSKPRVGLAVVIPSYCRGATVLNCVRALLALKNGADEIIVIDQTPQHVANIERELRALHNAGRMRWIQLSAPNIPRAMNVGLKKALHEIVLFVDDDIIPGSDLVQAHRYVQQQTDLVAGMVLQPGEKSVRLAPDKPFQFNSDQPVRIKEFMGGNFSVKRNTALMLGGFDENFVGAAYRFEAEFAHRYVNEHGLILYEPRAIIHHLRVPTGGTRAHGHHLHTLRPTHSVGAYYELLRTRRPRWLRQLLLRPLRSVRTRHHLRRPWWIPLTLLAELRGLLLALKLHRGGAKLLDRDAIDQATDVSTSVGAH